MKIEITLMTENSKHAGEEYTDKDLIDQMTELWNEALKHNMHYGDIAYVTNVKVIER